MDEVCECGEQISVQLTTCPACGRHLGSPNVRLLTVNRELEQFETRYAEAIGKARSEGIESEFLEVEEKVAKDGGLVIAVPLNLAEEMIDSPKFCYVNYEKLVGADARQPATFANDSQRRVVSGALFAGIGEEIVYGALSLTTEGLATYGDIFCRLKETLIQARTTFLETNSYEFVRQHGTSLPLGYRCDWENKGRLAAVKLLGMGAISLGCSEAEWANQLLYSDGKNRNLDQFIEGHLFGTFTLHTVADMAPAFTGAGPSTLHAVLEAFVNLRNGSG